MCKDSVVWAYFVAVGLGEVGSVNGEAEALDTEEDWMQRRPTVPIDDDRRTQGRASVLSIVQMVVNDSRVAKRRRVGSEFG